MTINKALMTSNSMEWETPQKLFDALNNEFHFDTDICANIINAKCRNYINKIDEPNQWPQCKVGFMNPPYGRTIGKFIETALYQSWYGKRKIVCLVPARVDTQWWGLIWDFKLHMPKAGIQVRFLKGRLKFEVGGKPMQAAPFPSALIIMNLSSI